MFLIPSKPHPKGTMQGKVGPGDALVVRYQGPRGGPAFAECLGALIDRSKARKVQDVIVIADGRFSGFTQGYLSIGHVCPEAQVGGPLALVKDGDRINLDIPGAQAGAGGFGGGAEKDEKRSGKRLPSPK